MSGVRYQCLHAQQVRRETEHGVERRCLDCGIKLPLLQNRQDVADFEAKMAVADFLRTLPGVVKP